MESTVIDDNTTRRARDSSRIAIEIMVESQECVMQNEETGQEMERKPEQYILIANRSQRQQLMSRQYITLECMIIISMRSVERLRVVQ